MFSRPKILFLVSLLFVALLNPKFNPYLLFKFLIFYHSIYTYIHTYIIYTYIHTYMHTYIHTCIHTYIHAYIHTYMHTYIHTCIHTYIHTYIHAYIHTYIHTCMHAYIHTYTGMCPDLGEWWLHKGVLNVRNLVIFNIYAQTACRHFYFCVKWLARLSTFIHTDILVLVSESVVVVILSEWWLFYLSGGYFI